MGDKNKRSMCCQEPPAVINCWGRFFVKFCPRFLETETPVRPLFISNPLTRGDSDDVPRQFRRESVFSITQSLQSVSNNFRIRQSEGISFLGKLRTWANFCEVKVRMLGIAAGERMLKYLL